jgi:hypothetical protein
MIGIKDYRMTKGYKPHLWLQVELFDDHYPGSDFGEGAPYICKIPLSAYNSPNHSSVDNPTPTSITQN